MKGSRWDLYGRDGKPIHDLEAIAEDANDPKYWVIARTTLPDGKFVSTIWLGLDHNAGEGPPLIFETMVFPSEKNPRDLNMQRYATIEEARAGHEAMVKKWGGGEQ